MDMGHFFVDGAVDEAGAALAGKVGEKPLGEDDEAVAEADQVENVDKTPGEPGDESAELESFQTFRSLSFCRWWPSSLYQSRQTEGALFWGGSCG